NEDGSLDASFNAAGPTPGVVRQDVGGQADAANALVRDGTGRYVVACSATGESNTTDVLVARYLATGALDTTFGAAHSGLVLLPEFGNGTDVGFGLALQTVPAGAVTEERLVVSGLTQVGGVDAFALARLLPNGRRDPTFGVGGLVQTGLATGPSRSLA